MPSQHNAAVAGGAAATNTNQRIATTKKQTIVPNGNANVSGQNRRPNAKEKERERNERDRLVLWRKPVTTFEYCFREIVFLLQIYWKKYVCEYAFIGHI